MKTTAHIPPSEAAQYDKLKRPSAASQAVADGYTDTKELRKARASTTTGAAKGQYGLPKSGKRSVVRM